MNGQHPDSLRALLDSVFAAPTYRWVERPEPLAALRHAWAAFRHWVMELSDAYPTGFRAVLYLLVVIMLVTVVRAAWTFLATIRSDDRAETATAAGFVPRDQGWYRREADRLAAAGRFVEAIQADFLGLVLALDARAVLRFHPSKTPGEYARESALAPGPREEFRDLVNRLYRYAFARSPCGLAEYTDWRARAIPERYAPAH